LKIDPSILSIYLLNEFSNQYLINKYTKNEIISEFPSQIYSYDTSFIGFNSKAKLMDFRQGIIFIFFK
jgi:hypothetical protein